MDKASKLPQKNIFKNNAQKKLELHQFTSEAYTAERLELSLTEHTFRKK